MFGDVGDVDPVRHMIGTAGGFGGNPEKEAIYLNSFPEKNDGKTPYVLTVKDVPVDGFWSVSVYNGEGFFEKNEANMYSFNNLTAKRNNDGSITINFGSDPKQLNNGTTSCACIGLGMRFWTGRESSPRRSPFGKEK